ncbi:hypothetical protein kochi14H1_0230 [Enterococcus phage phi EF14H1]|uniref:Phage protein n=9 Tax=Kochikohdavirus TaxID=2560160 RepID=A8E274_BPPHE|nr:hypothetical protein EFP_gp022 [Enterococcus phage EF24C]YP_009219872.2 hypothetical protein AVT53_p24 [Enterococcus phage EFLK1]AZU99935.1 hypothetical protein vBEfaHEF1TV_91 [Enterococcus phage vB_EfaH_EF1TV]QBZ69698.1 hypothetical protein [Enterococcus phage vB_EfaM_Ef2.1]QBZ70113.1 hypothetical protein [Enterococcus phage vB_EfaM_Ef2.3]QPW37213.1 hypothetical protein [Enterococcus phage PBEF129]QVW27921.1 hypothetical protein [Enterococcus phage MDA2]USL84302.1 hypothetical protein Sw
MAKETEKVVKKEVKKEQPKKPKGYVHVDTFLDYAKVLYGLNKYQVAGFRALMAGREYQHEDADFVPFLEKYIGKEVK